MFKATCQKQEAKNMWHKISGGSFQERSYLLPDHWEWRLNPWGHIRACFSLLETWLENLFEGNHGAEVSFSPKPEGMEWRWGLSQFKYVQEPEHVYHHNQRGERCLQTSQQAKPNQTIPVLCVVGWPCPGAWGSELYHHVCFCVPIFCRTGWRFYVSLIFKVYYNFCPVLLKNISIFS